MAVEPHQMIQINHLIRDAFPPTPPILHQQYYTLQDAGVLPGAANDQLEGHGEALPQPVRGAVASDRLYDPYHVDVAHHGMVDYYPLPIYEHPVFPDEGIAQGIPAQGRPNAPENQRHDPFVGHVPQPVPQFPAPGQPAAENLRRLAIRYLHRPDSQVDLVAMEPGVAGHCKVVIILELADIL